MQLFYDEEEDILSLSKSRKVKASIDIGDFIIDIDHSGFVVGMEILNASENLKMGVDQLKNLQKASMAVTYKPNYVYITLVMLFKNKEKDLAIPLTVDLWHRSISTQNMNFAAA